MKITDQIIAKNKVIATIESCETMDHFFAAKKLIQLYRVKTNDILGFFELDRIYFDGVMNLPIEPEKARMFI